MTIKVYNRGFCEGCEHFSDLGTLGGHHKCALYKRVMVPDFDAFNESRGLGYFKRLAVCMTENEPVVGSQST